MSSEHLRAQERVFALLSQAHERADVELEAVLDGGAAGPGRADVLVTPNDGSQGLCLEIQRSTMSAAGLVEREQQRAAAGYGLEWIFLFPSGRIWEKPHAKVPRYVKEVLDRRGYALALEDPLADDPRIRVFAHRSLAGSIEVRRPPHGMAIVLRGRWRFAEARATSRGLFHDRLSSLLLGWIEGYARCVESQQPTDPGSIDVASQRWQRGKERRARELDHAARIAAAAERSVTDAATAADRAESRYQELATALEDGRRNRLRLIVPKTRRALRELERERGQARAAVGLAIRAQERAEAALEQAQESVSVHREDLLSWLAEEGHALEQDRQSTERERARAQEAHAKRWERGRGQARRWLERLPRAPGDW
ncbi:MAG TPA: hypothetical protein VIJ33_01955 [Solirubrobacteraceae bacterium]